LPERGLVSEMMKHRRKAIDQEKGEEDGKFHGSKGEG